MVQTFRNFSPKRQEIIIQLFTPNIPVWKNSNRNRGKNERGWEKLNSAGVSVHRNNPFSPSPGSFIIVT